RRLKICRAQPFPNDRKLLALNCVLSVGRSSPLRSGWRSMGSALRGRSPHSLHCGVHRPNTLDGGMTIVQSLDAKLRRTAIMVHARLGVMVGKDMPTSVHRQSFIDTKPNRERARRQAVPTRALVGAGRAITSLLALLVCAVGSASAERIC